MYLASMSWSKAQELKGDALAAIVPLGSVEQHGPLGPLGTDYIIPRDLAARIEARLPDRVLVLPTLPYGSTPAHLSFPGTVNIGYEALCTVLRAIVDAVLGCGVRRVLFLNGHGGNAAAIDTAALYLYHRGGQGAEIDWWTLCAQLNPDWRCGHGGGVETAVAMAVKPDWVHPEDLFESRIAHLSPRLRNTHIHSVEFEKGTVKMVRDVRDAIPSGDAGYGDIPARANPNLGAEILDAVTDYAERFILEFLTLDLTAGRRTGAGSEADKKEVRR
ncbi:MAG: creatininase family protein [Synergistaceae bacterium]|jgi:creatinine amidohydrolase|nr:creatininase family protein [Synergistaceae bacterium]